MGRRYINRYLQLRRINIQFTKEDLTDTTGLGQIIDVFHISPMAKEFPKCLPERKSCKSNGGYKLALTMMASMIYGHDSIDDLEEFRNDPYLKGLFDSKMPAARTMGDFLRDFTEEHINKLNEYLHKMAMSLRKQLEAGLEAEYKPGAPIIDIDSTDHEQSGNDMEGLAWNYKDHWCLDSQVVFDELGLCHGAQLRPGNTKSGVGAGKLINNTFAGMNFREEKSLRADSAYCTEEVINACLSKGVKFTITAHRNIGWEERLDEVTEWVPWQYSEEEIKKAEKRGKKLPRVELGRIYWSPGFAPTLKFPVLIKRTWRESEQISMLEETSWDYYAIATNMDIFTNSYQEIYKHHQKRGNAENFIREEKYGYDLKSFPCQKLLANHAYLLLTMVAHNMLRWVAHLSKPDKPHYSKKVRRMFIHIPARVVKHARELVLKVPMRYKKEVEFMLVALRATPIPAWGFS